MQPMWWFEGDLKLQMHILGKKNDLKVLFLSRLNKGEKPVTEESGSIPKSCVESLGPTIGNYQDLPHRPHERKLLSPHQIWCTTSHCNFLKKVVVKDSDSPPHSSASS